MLRLFFWLTLVVLVAPHAVRAEYYQPYPQYVYSGPYWQPAPYYYYPPSPSGYPGYFGTTTGQFLPNGDPYMGPITHGRPGNNMVVDPAGYPMYYSGTLRSYVSMQASPYAGYQHYVGPAPAMAPSSRGRWRR